MDHREFKKLLIDLDLTKTEIAQLVGLSYTGVTKYFRGELRDANRRRQIKRVLQRRARQQQIALPDFWQDGKAA